MEITELIKEYREREKRWTKESLSQLSFVNNLLLGFGVGFLTFGYNDSDVKNMHITLTNIDWHSTIIVLSVLLSCLSISFGLGVVINRLYDFRVTREIVQIRHRMAKHSAKLMSEKSPEKFHCLKRLILPYQVMFFFPKITLEECKSYHDKSLEEKEKIELSFKNLRSIAYNLGLNSWQKTTLQIFCFGLSILLYVVQKLFF